MKLEKGTLISHYKILSEIGEGGMGEVYLAQDLTLDRKVALKMLTDECCEDSERLARFIQEAKAASSLNHPNIITIFEFSEHDGTHFLASELIEGQELTELLAEQPLSLEEALKISIQLVSALKTAHEAGIIHRDIKPNNIMVRKDGIVKVLDFGLAKLVKSRNSDFGMKIGEDETLIQSPDNPQSVHHNPQLTTPGLIMGTPNYMSPEQARGKDTDHQTDIFSFGVLFYEMLTCIKPFDGETTSDVIASVLARNPLPLCEVNSDLPLKAEAIIDKCINKNKKDRYQTAGLLLDDLKDLEQDLQVQQRLTMIGQTNPGIDASLNLGVQTAAASPEQNSIAVLPFSNMSLEERSDYFSDGLTEEIVVNLSKLKMLKVVPRGSTPASVIEGRSHKEMAEVLGVRYLLEGSVRRHEDDLRISAQLIDTEDQAYLWSETYRGTIRDVFEIQEKVATEIVGALKVTLSPGEEEILKKRFTDNTEAYQLYLQGRFFWNKRSVEGLNTAIDYFEKAIEVDPEYALAWAGIADSYGLMAEFGKTPHKKLYPKAEAAVKMALSIDDNLAEAHASLASLLLFNKWDWKNSKIEFERALELNPNYATAYHWYSFWYLGMGDLEESIRLVSRAAELDPVSQAIMKDKGMVFYHDRQYSKAIELAQTTLKLDPNYPAAHRLLSLSYQAKGLFEKAIIENDCWGMLTDNQPEADFCRAQIYAAAGREKEARDLIKSIEEDPSKIDNVYRGLALVYSSLGEIDQALEMLKKSCEIHEIALLSIKVDPKLDRVRSDPRFDNVLKILGVS